MNKKILLAMKNVDRIRNFVLSQRNSGCLNPGDRLPSYKKLMKRFNLSYVTVASGVQELAKEGLLETRKGSGSYLSGTSSLKVLINIHPTTISCYKMRMLLNKYLANAALHIDFDIQAVEELGNPRTLSDCINKYKAAISCYSAFSKEHNLPAAQLKGFPDYDKVISELKTIPGLDYEDCLPFSYTGYLAGINLDLLDRAGFSEQLATPFFSWWEDFAKQCRKLDLAPASIDFQENISSIFIDLLPVMMILLPYTQFDYTGKAPLFSTCQAADYFRIAEDCALVRDPLHDKHSFFRNGAVFNFLTGSWLTMQNSNPGRTDKKISNLAFLPYRDINGNKFHLLTEETIKLYLHREATVDERIRVWKLMKMMTSREFQTEYCSITGQLSANHDVLPTEHFWNRHRQYDDFFPQAGEKQYFIRQMYQESQYSALSTLLENYLCYGHDFQEIVKRMDIKKMYYHCSNEYKEMQTLEDCFWNRQTMKHKRK